MACKHVCQNLPEDAISTATRQAARERRRGDHRKSMLLLRRAAFEAGEQRPGLWTRYAFACMRGGKTEDGRKAFAQAVWLHERTGHERSAEITRLFAERAEQGNLPRTYSR